MRRLAVVLVGAALWMSALFPTFGVAGPALAVDLTQPTHPISPYIYGMNYADPALAAEINLPLNRWGGNDTSRYDAYLDTSSKGMDYFFMNVPYRQTSGDPNRPLPEQSAIERYIRSNQSWSGDTIVTIPMLGWLPKDEAFRCSFSQASYPNQTDFDNDGHNCGNGILPGGAHVTSNNVADTSVALTETYVSDWVGHLVTRYGAADAGGVRFYNLDNEPMLWNETHRDVFKEPLDYDGLRDRTYTYGAAVKAADPTALTLGPAGYGWEEYFYSALDWAPGNENAWWNTRTDRMAHGDVPLAEWYLQQMAVYETNNGVRILDYLDEHFYPFFVALNDNVDGGMAAQRLRATRFLWDASYNQQPDNWYVEEPFRLIPRMKEWVANNYPGTKTAITEYNFGALNDINGALAQADVLGIFGREGLDLATLWEPPDADEPGAYSFRMYLNYDGAGSDFGDTSVSASSADQGKVSVYAATRTSDGALTIIVVNKTGSTQTSTLTLTGFDGESGIDVYRYSAGNLNEIVQPGDELIVAGQFIHDFPANSITLFVASPAAGPSVDLVANGSFETGLSDWVFTKKSGEKRKCDAANPTKFASSGSCGLLLTGSSGKTIVTQTLLTVSGAAGDDILLSAFARGKGLAATIQIKAVLTTAAGPQTLVFKLAKGSYPFQYKQAAGDLLGDLLSGKVQILIKGGTGSAYIDELQLIVSAGARGAVIPPPQIPSGFRN